MRIFILIFIIVYIGSGGLISQNLISNPSFTIIKEKTNKSLPYQILKEKQSEVKDWYIPNYINNNSKNYGNKYHVHYFSSRDTELIPKNRAFTKRWDTNTEQFFENNLGFLTLQIIDFNFTKETTVVQQKLRNIIEKGYYCFKFRYKTISLYNKKKTATINFSFSNTDLKEYYSKQDFKIPAELIQVSFLDTVKSYQKDDNTPWHQSCHKIYLNGNEQYLSFGGLVKKSELNWNDRFYIDDVELYYDTAKCECEKINKDLSLIYNKTFEIDKIYETDSLVTFKSVNINSGNGLMSPHAKYYLNNIIAFMQKNPTVKIKFIEHSLFNPTSPPYYCNTYLYYLKFYGITKDRIISESINCIDSTGYFCKPSSDYVKIDFKFYTE